MNAAPIRTNETRTLTPVDGAQTTLDLWVDGWAEWVTSGPMKQALRSERGAGVMPVAR